MYLLFLQEKTDLAVTTNRIRRSASDSALVNASGDSVCDNQVVLPAMGPQPVWSTIGDEHFAISESTVDNARANCNGNWVELGHQQFRQNYGQFVECSEDTAALFLNQSEEDEDEDAKCCQSSFGPGLCRKRLVSPLLEAYNALFDSVVDLLRSARDVRRTQGYVAHHPLLLLFDGDSDSILRPFVLARVSFNPFDATLLEFQMKPGSDTTAELVTEQGQAKMHRLPTVLFEIAQTVQRPVLKTSSYMAISLNEIQIDDSKLQCIADYINQHSSGASDEEGEDNQQTGALSLRSTKQAMMRALQGSKAVKKTVTKQKPRQTNKNAPRKKPTKGTGSKEAETVQNADEGVSDHIDVAVLTEWGAALDQQLGPMPLVVSSAAAASSSSSSAVPAAAATAAASSSSGPPPVPIVSKTAPWRDAKGYSWIYNADSGKAFFIGASLSSTNVSSNCELQLVNCEFI